MPSPAAAAMEACGRTETGLAAIEDCGESGTVVSPSVAWTGMATVSTGIAAGAAGAGDEGCGAGAAEVEAAGRA